MVNSLDVEKWQLDTINKILKEKDTKLVLIIINSNDSLKSKFHRIWEVGVSRIFFAIYRDYICRPRALRKHKLDN